MQRSVSLRLAAVLAVAAAALTGCSRAEEAAAPAGSIDVTLSRQQVPQGSPLEVRYRITVAPDAKPFPNGTVFVHFLDADDEQMWTDDHLPPTSTAQWKPGDTVEYTRTMFVPVYPYVGVTKVVAGIYNRETNERVPLTGQDQGDREYAVATFELQPQTENVFLMFKDGWHGAEMAPENKTVEWQWTKGLATLAFRNPKRDAVLFLQVDNPAATQARGATAMQVNFRDAVLATLPVTADQSPVHRVPLPAGQLGNDEMIELQLVPDRTFVPALVGGAAADTRELGVRVFHAFIQTPEIR